MLLDQRFEEVVRDLVGDRQFVELAKTVGWAKARNDFEKNIKTSFTGDLSSVNYVMFPKAHLHDDPEKGLEDNCWELTGKTLGKIFDPIISEIMVQVNNQVLAARDKRPGQWVKAVFLVGGFGSSRYLKKCLEDTFAPLGIQVIQPHDAWASIVK